MGNTCDLGVKVWTSEGCTHIVLPAALDAAEAAVDLLREQWKREGLSKEALFKLVLVLREALLNAVVHGNGADATRTVALEIRLVAGRADITVSDQGPGFNWRTLFSGCDTPPDPTCSNGRGLCIMLHYASNVHYNESGNVLTLSVSLP